MTQANELTLENDRCRLVLDPFHGGRIAQVTVDGANLVVGRPNEETADPVRWGSYPMVPFAGRVRHGIVRFDGRIVQLPITMGPHAMHGYGLVSPWTVESADASQAVLSFELGAPWPWPATVTQKFELSDTHLDLNMALFAHERQPVSLGWHPWFNRDAGVGSDLSLTFDANAMYETDDEAIPTGRLIDVAPEPWDNCFVGAGNPQLAWGSMRLELQSDAACWVVYNEPVHAICVEPQTGPPNGVNDSPDVVESGESLTVSMRWSWSAA